MYWLEIHRDDLLKRSTAALYIRSTAIENIINSHSIDSNLYKLNFDFLQKKMAYASKNSISRKTIAAISLNWERMVFYWIPFLTLFYFFIRAIWKSEKKTRKVPE